MRLGASVPYTQIMENLRAELPGLALASPHRRLPADPQPRRRRRQPRHRLPGRRRPPRAARGGRRGRGRVRTRHPAHPGRRLLHRREAQRARRRRADPGRAHQEGGRPAAVLQGRHAQRDGDRGVRLRPGPAPREPHGPYRHRLGRAHTRPGHGRRGVPERGARRGRLLGQRQDHHPVGRPAVRRPVRRRLQPDRRRPRHRGLPPPRGRRHGPPHADVDLGVVPRHRPPLCEGAA